MPFNRILFYSVFPLIVLSGCGHDKGQSNNPVDQPPACSDAYILQYNGVKTAIDTVKADMDAAYGPQKPTDSAAMIAADKKAYNDAQDCRANALSMKTNYNGVKCTALQDDKPVTIDTNAKMDEIIKAMDLVPVA